MAKYYLNIFERVLNTTALIGCCLTKSDVNKYTAAVVQNSSNGRSVYEICTCCVEADCNGRQASDSTFPRLNERNFMRKMVPKCKKPKTQKWCVVCSKHR